MIGADDVIEAIKTIRCGAAATEEELHMLVARALDVAGIGAKHEARLASRCRIDFLAGDIGIEIKKNRPDRTKLIAQLSRYADCACISQLVVIAPRAVHLPRRIGGKPGAMVALERLWGIWLP